MRFHPTWLRSHNRGGLGQVCRRSPHVEARARLMLLVLVLALVSCSRKSDPVDERRPPTETGPAASAADLGNGATTHAPSAPTADPHVLAHESALQELERVLALEPLPGAPGFEKQRASIVARAKGEPIFFVRAPQAAQDSPPGVVSKRHLFEETDYSWRTLKSIRATFKRRKPLLREILLREGYVYSERPSHAYSLVSQLTVSDLFDEPELWIQRAEYTLRARRDEDGEYRFIDGPWNGHPLRLLHLDRLGIGEPPEEVLHRDFRGLKYRLFFEQARVRHITEEYLVADLRYGPHWVPTVLRSEGARLEKVAEVVAPDQLVTLTEARSRAERKARAVTRLREAMVAQIQEALPFDEPKTEIGQEDGKLRRPWMYAYLEGRDSYEYNGDKYPVFDRLGRPRVPQVCIDFMIDTFERAAGSWWRPLNEGKRERTTGRLDLTEYPRDFLRSTYFFLKLASERTDMFDLLRIPERQRIEMGYKERFFRWLSKRVEQFEPGDIVLIRGLTPWDPVEEHTHSFFVYEVDPMSGIPIAIAGNAGPANLWSWETEARRTPKRTVRSRVRPKLEWLETFIDTAAQVPLHPPALVMTGD